MVQEPSKNCIACDKPLKGRTDKKFCDDYCRTTYNNHLKADSSKVVRNINNALRKNRHILEELVSGSDDKEKAKTNREKLLHNGFQFKYQTHTYTNQKGNVYYFCYEYGYLPLENNWFLIVKRNEKN